MIVSYPVATIEIYKNNEGSVLNCCCVCFPFPSRSYISFIIWIPSYFCVSYIIHQKCSTILLKMGWSLRRLNLNTWSFKVWILTSFDASMLRGLLYLYFVFLCCICILYFYMYAGWGWRLPPCLWWPLITSSLAHSAQAQVMSLLTLYLLKKKVLQPEKKNGWSWKWNVEIVAENSQNNGFGCESRCLGIK